MIAGDGQSEINVLNREAHRVCCAAVVADERADPLCSEQQYVGLHGAGIGERKSSRCLLEGEFARSLEEAPDAKIELPDRACDRSRRGIEVDRDGTAGAGRDFDGFGEEVDLRSAVAGTSQLNAEIRTAERQVVAADEGDRTGGGQQRRPGAGGVLLIGGQQQGEFHIGGREAECSVGAAIQADEGVGPGRSDGQEVRFDFRGVRQRDRTCGFPEREVAGDLHEAEEVEGRMRFDLHDLALCAVEVERDRRCCAGHDHERCVGEVEHKVGVGGVSDRRRHLADRDAQTVAARESRAVDGRLQQQELAGFVGSVGREYESEVDSGRFKADRILAAAVETDEGVGVGRSEAQQIDHDLAAVRKFDRANRLLESEVAGHREEAIDR